mmetsp:Transcript_26369/g.26616  ORF Transcript_26369/g.26616 Transcript_26369/m.26616 type:complete len:156 (-) Transcript_26369:86-553(-)
MDSCNKCFLVFFACALGFIIGHLDVDRIALFANEQKVLVSQIDFARRAYKTVGESPFQALGGALNMLVMPSWGMIIAYRRRRIVDFASVVLFIIWLAFFIGVVLPQDMFMASPKSTAQDLYKAGVNHLCLLMIVFIGLLLNLCPAILGESQKRSD